MYLLPLYSLTRVSNPFDSGIKLRGLGFPIVVVLFSLLENWWQAVG